MKKIVLFAFNGDSMCFIHVLLNALDMNHKGYEVKIVIEGAATKLVPDLVKEGAPLNPLYRKVKELGLIEGACKACSNKMGALEAVTGEEISLLDDMSGHPSMAHYMEQGFQVITF